MLSWAGGAGWGSRAVQDPGGADGGGSEDVWGEMGASGWEGKLLSPQRQQPWHRAVCGAAA